jgi:murein DD-endopeptidase MepM/ murein hydrolase activator NlpD
MRRYIKLLLLFFVAFGIIILTIPYLWVLIKTKEEAPVKIKPLIKHRFAYKINIDSLDIQYGKVKNNQNLSTILSPLISANLIDRIAKETGNIFDVRKVHTGQQYAVISDKKTPRKTLYFIYEINNVDHVVYDFRDSLRVYRDRKQVSIQRKTTKGTIQTSLWNAFENNNLDVNLGMRMSDVYAWTIDFYGLQKGDHFKLIYEELYVDSAYIGTGRILASEFSSNGKDFYAYYFEQDSTRGYYDDLAKSMRRSFLKAPLKFSRISSRFSGARMHPVLRIVRPHFGVDYAAPRGTPVVALGDGRIAEADFKGGYGRFISIRHNSVYTTTYAHLSGYAKGIKAGAFVKQGDLIGFVGMSGLATGPHLDFRVYRNGSPTDPLKLESPAADPVPGKYRTAYAKIVAKYKQQLDSIK